MNADAQEVMALHAEVQAAAQVVREKKAAAGRRLNALQGSMTRAQWEHWCRECLLPEAVRKQYQELAAQPGKATVTGG